MTIENRQHQQGHHKQVHWNPTVNYLQSIKLPLIFYYEQKSQQHQPQLLAKYLSDRTQTKPTYYMNASHRRKRMRCTVLSSVLSVSRLPYAREVFIICRRVWHTSARSYAKDARRRQGWVALLCRRAHFGRPRSLVVIDSKIKSWCVLRAQQKIKMGSNRRAQNWYSRSEKPFPV